MNDEFGKAEQPPSAPASTGDAVRVTSHSDTCHKVSIVAGNQTIAVGLEWETRAEADWYAEQTRRVIAKISAPSPMEAHAAEAHSKTNPVLPGDKLPLTSGDAERRVLAKPVKFSTRGDDVKVPPMGLLNRAAEKFGDDGTAPDAFWWKDFFNLTGEHMICTQEDGWVDGSAKGEYLPDDILDEVNAQPTPAPSQDAEQTPVKGVDRG